MIRALLIGREPGMALGYEYVQEEPFEAVVIGSLTLGELLKFREERVLSALAEGKPVYLYTPGLPCLEGVKILETESETFYQEINGIRVCKK